MGLWTKELKEIAKDSNVEETDRVVGQDKGRGLAEDEGEFFVDSEHE